MIIRSTFALILAGAVVGCASGKPLPGVTPSQHDSADPVASAPTVAEADLRLPTGRFGLLVMAHGGDSTWNASVETEVEQLRGTLPVALAFGMANPMTLQAALDKLERQGVRTAAVVRLFLSGESFREQTDWYLGMSDTPPSQFVLMGPAAADPGARGQIEHDLELVTHDHGLLDTDLVRDILIDRAASLSDSPDRESVLLIAHGMGDEEKNSAVEADLERIASAMARRGYASVDGTTLREDWPDKRVQAEAEIRAFIDRESDAGRRVIVLPARLSGFGPYAEVLDGLEYVPGEGILPHPRLSDWILSTGTELGCGRGWVTAEACGR